MLINDDAPHLNARNLSTCSIERQLRVYVVDYTHRYITGRRGDVHVYSTEQRTRLVRDPV